MALRFFYYGKVVYEDVFGIRYERTVCFKVANRQKLIQKFNREKELAADEVAAESADRE